MWEEKRRWEEKRGDDELVRLVVIEWLGVKIKESAL